MKCIWWKKIDHMLNQYIFDKYQLNNFYHFENKLQLANNPDFLFYISPEFSTASDP